MVALPRLFASASGLVALALALAHPARPVTPPMAAAILEEKPAGAAAPDTHAMSTLFEDLLIPEERCGCLDCAVEAVGSPSCCTLCNGHGLKDVPDLQDAGPVADGSYRN
ncbi:hypothetical protein PsYK624_011420 [Phanerochaete sordida]|uniref:Secreted protein n=1 Tax=Phanerochaete sordida TaxID=48140 RepID=A0A9P3FZM2_9APHY|nr:hypothetical protein PsYK624_011420 [Phanerochaete sordida]